MATFLHYQNGLLVPNGNRMELKEKQREPFFGNMNSFMNRLTSVLMATDSILALLLLQKLM